MLGHKTSLNKFKKVEITQNIFSDHNGKKLESRMAVTRDWEEEKRVVVWWVWSFKVR